MSSSCSVVNSFSRWAVAHAGATEALSTACSSKLLTPRES